MLPGPALAAAAIALPLLGGCVSTLVWAVHAATEMHWNGNTRIELPMVRDRQGHVGVAVQIRGKDVVAFLDTGAGLSGMNLDAVTMTGLPADPAENGSQLVKDVSIQIQGASLKLPMVGASKGLREVQLLLGQELFTRAVVEMDFVANRVTLIDPAAFEAPPEQPMRVKLDHSRPIVKMRVNGGTRDRCAMIDTGLGSGVVLASSVVAELGLPNLPGQTRRYFNSDGVQRETTALAPLDELSFEGRTYRDVPVMSRAPDDKRLDCDNLIGVAVLSRHRVIFDMGRKRIWLLAP